MTSAAARAAVQGGMVARAAAAVAPARAASSDAASKRPLSPHLTIYKFSPNMITSTTFRGTGIAMTVGEPAEGAQEDLPSLRSPFHAPRDA